MTRYLLALLLLLVGLLPASTYAQQSSVVSEPFTLQLGDFTSPAQLDYPAGQTGPFPTVILYHGGCYCDRDEAFGGRMAMYNRRSLRTLRNISPHMATLCCATTSAISMALERSIRRSIR